MHGSGPTPGEALDDLVSALLEVIEMIRRREVSENDPLRTLFSEFVDLNRPSPDPDAKVCGDQVVW